MDTNDLEKQMSENIRNMQAQSREFFRNVQSEQLSSKQHIDRMLIERQKLYSNEQLIHQIQQNNEETRKAFKKQEKATARQFWIALLVSGLSAIGAVISAIIAIISVVQ